MAYTALQSLHYPQGVPLGAMPSVSANTMTATLDGQLNRVLHASVSDIVLRPVANDNWDLLPKLDAHIKSNARLQEIAALQRAEERAGQDGTAPDAADDAHPSNVISFDAARRALARSSQPDAPTAEGTAPPAVTTVSVVDDALQHEIEQIKLQETVRFIQTLQADRLQRRSKAEIKQFLHFAAAQAALSLIAPDAVPELAQPGTTLDAAADGAAAHAAARPNPTQLNPLQLNPLALDTLADRWDDIAPHVRPDTKPAAQFAANHRGIAQPHTGAIARDLDDPLPQTVLSQLRLIALSNQFDPALMHEAEALTRGTAVGLPAFQPDAASQPALQLQRIQVLIDTAKEQRAVKEAETLQKTLGSKRYEPHYDVAVVGRGQRLMQKTVKGADITIDKPGTAEIGQLSLDQPDVNPDQVAQTLSARRDDMIRQLAENFIGSQNETRGLRVDVEHVDGRKVGVGISQKHVTNEQDADADDIQGRFSRTAQDMNLHMPELKKAGLNVALAV